MPESRRSGRIRVDSGTVGIPALSHVLGMLDLFQILFHSLYQIRDIKIPHLGGTVRMENRFIVKTILIMISQMRLKLVD